MTNIGCLKSGILFLWISMCVCVLYVNWLNAYCTFILRFNCLNNISMDKIGHLKMYGTHRLWGFRLNHNIFQIKKKKWIPPDKSLENMEHCFVFALRFKEYLFVYVKNVFFCCCCCCREMSFNCCHKLCVFLFHQENLIKNCSSGLRFWMHWRAGFIVACIFARWTTIFAGRMILIKKHQKSFRRKARSRLTIFLKQCFSLWELQNVVFFFKKCHS